MNRVTTKFQELDHRFITFFEGRVIKFLRISIGVIYFLFGILKFLPQYSPAEELAVTTISLITFGLFSGKLALVSLAIIETIIGIGLIVNFKIRLIILLALWHMFCTFLPMIILPQATYTDTPYSLSLVGQYILKNLIIICALIAIYVESRKS